MFQSMSNKLGSGVYLRPEHRSFKLAKLSPSCNVSIWDEELGNISPKHHYGDIRSLSWFTVPINKIAVIHYYNNSEKKHFKFTLINGTDIHVVREGDNDDNVRFITYYSGVSDLDYVNDHMMLELNLKQVQALIIGFTTREGFVCVRCKDPDNLVPSFRHMTCIRDLEDEEAVDALWTVMNNINARLRQLKCRMSTKTGRIEAEIDANNLYAGSVCFQSEYIDKNSTTPKTFFKQDQNSNVAISVPISRKRKSEEDDGYFSDINVEELQKNAEVESERQKKEKKVDSKGKSARDFWMRRKISEKPGDYKHGCADDDAKSVDNGFIDESSSESYKQIQYENSKIAEFEKEMAEANPKKTVEKPISEELSTTLDLLDEMLNVAKEETISQCEVPEKKEGFETNDNSYSITMEEVD